MDEQMTLFGMMYPEYRISGKIELFEIFAGIGTQSAALERLGADFEVALCCEWDVNSILAYKAINKPDDNTDYSDKLNKDDVADFLIQKGISGDGKEPMEAATVCKKPERWLRDVYNAIIATHNAVDVTKLRGEQLELNKMTDKMSMLTYSFPCQDISVAGNQKGFSKGTDTRSGMLWEVERILRECKDLGRMPDVLIMENVAAIHSQKFIPDFQIWLDVLKGLGYSTYWQDLNAKDYGVPQNRLRTFAVSLYGEYSYTFPHPIELKTRLKDVLESSVDERYYVSNSKAQKLIKQLVANGKLPQNKAYRANDDMTEILGTAEPDGTERTGIDFSQMNPQQIDIANCITAREDRGISNVQRQGTGVVECVGSLYYNQSDGFQRGILDDGTVSRTVKSDSHPVAVVEKEVVGCVRMNMTPEWQTGVQEDIARTVGAEKDDLAVIEKTEPVLLTPNGFGSKDGKYHGGQKGYDVKDCSLSPALTAANASAKPYLVEPDGGGRP